MRDPEKPLKVISGIVSGLLVVSALIYFLFASGKPKQAEAVLEYSAAPGLDPSELTSELHRLRKDQGILALISIRSKLTTLSDPELAEIVANLGSRLSFDADMKGPAISIRFTHRNAATAIAVANTAAEVVKESLENLQRKLATEIRVQEKITDDKWKLLDQMRRVEAIGQRSSQTEPGLEMSAEKQIALPRSTMLVDAQKGYDHAVRKLEELKTKPVFSLGSIRPAKLTGPP